MTFRRGRALCAAASALGLVLYLAPPAAAETLADAISLAYTTNPALLAARGELRATDERYVQAQAALGPTVTASANGTTDDAAVTQASLLGKPTTKIDHAQNYTAEFTARQPLYDGGQLSAAVAVARAEVLAGRQSLRKTESTVLGDVIAAYLDVILARELLEIARQNVEILADQNAETLAKVKVRDLTITDQFQSRARLLAARIRLTQVRSQLTDSESKYLSTVGQFPGELAPPPDLPGVPPTIDAAFTAAEQAAPAYLLARYTELASRARVREAKGAYGFQVSASFRMAREPVAAYLKRTEINSSVATVTVTKPIFSSGAQSSRVREAVETNYSDSLKVDDSHRQTLLGVAHSWTTLVSARAILQDLRDQLIAEKEAFDGSKAEQRVGIRSTIDLLNAEQEYQDTKISLAQKYRDEYIGRANLLEAIGVLTVEMIEPDMATYQPERSFNHVMRTQALPWNRLVEAIDSLGEKPLGLQTSSRDPLGAGHMSGLDGMPSAPSWAELSRILAELPTRR